MDKVHIIVGETASQEEYNIEKIVPARKVD